MERVVDKGSDTERFVAESTLNLLLIHVTEKAELPTKWARSWAYSIVRFSDTTPEVESLDDEEGAKVSFEAGDKKIELELSTDSISVKSNLRDTLEQTDDIIHHEPLSFIQLGSDYLLLSCGSIQETVGDVLRNTSFAIAIQKKADGSVEIVSGPRSELTI